MTLEPKPPVVNVVAGLLERSGRFLLSRRRAGSHLEGTWEFPGGKARPGEPLQEALRREMAEETGLRVGDGVLLHVEEHGYPDRKVVIHFFLCLDVQGEPQAKEGQAMRWLSMEELARLETPAANRRFLKLLEDQYGG